ncbi:hypothetical protein ABBQ32_010467 [Trebouxia sp. C0010 RCD-2024]
MGVKMLPPGTHLVSYNAASRTGDFSPTTSFFVHLAPGEVYIRRWNHEQELLEDISADEAEPYAAGVRRFDFDQNLAPYNLHAYQQWQNLSSYISKQTVSKLSPLPSGNISITAEADPAHLKPVTLAEKQLYAQLQEGHSTSTESGSAPMQVDGQQQPQTAASDRAQDMHSMQTPDLTPREGVGRCYYTQLPRLVKVAGMTPQQLTALNLDKTGMLHQVLQKHYSGSGDELLGELQFSFLAFLMGQSLEGFAQWKAIIHLLLGCEEAPIRSHVQLFIKALRCLLCQLQHSLTQEPAKELEAPPEVEGQASGVDGPFGMTSLVEEFLADSFLQQLFAKYFAMLADEAPLLNTQLQSVSKQVQQLLEQKLGWDFQVQGVGQDDDEDEYAPVVVQLDNVTL